MAKDEAKGTNVAGKVAPGRAVGEDSLGAAVGVLNSQHPQKWNDLGPHHGDAKLPTPKPGRAVI